MTTLTHEPTTRWTPEEKLQLVLDSYQADNVQAFCRERGIDRSYLYQLRRELEQATLDLTAWLRTLAAGLQEAVQRATRWGGRLWRTLRGQTTRKAPRVGREQLNLTDLELEATMEQILEHPWMGGKKRAANLAHDEVAWLGAQACDAIKNMIAQYRPHVQSSRSIRLSSRNTR